MKVIGYCRVSTESQGIDGYGMDAQREALRAEAARRGWDLTLVEEVMSGASVEARSELTAVIGAMLPGDVLVCSKLDRLSRSLPDFARLMERAEKGGWTIRLLEPDVDTSTPMGELVASIIAAVAQFERRMISQRTREGLERSRARGIWPGPARRVPPWVEDEIRLLRDSGMTFDAIGRRLIAEGIRPPGKGDSWHRKSIKRIYERPSRDAA